MRAADIERLDHRARARFTYQADPAERDEWRSRAAAVMAEQAWTGDCDDLAATVLDLAGRAGAKLEARFRLVVDTRCTGHINHQVAAILDDAGRFTVAGDTFGAAYPAELCGHQVLAYHRLDEWRPDGEPIWRDGAPWQNA